VTAAKGWQRCFDDPIVLADGRKLVTLRDAATYITKLQKAEQYLEIWQIAVENLIRAAETGGASLMLARIGLLKALHRGRARVLGQAEAEAGSVRPICQALRAAFRAAWKHQAVLQTTVAHRVARGGHVPLLGRPYAAVHRDMHGLGSPANDIAGVGRRESVGDDSL
jgi:hypothetical protein